MAFRLKVIDLGTDEDGDALSTCLAVEADAASEPVKLPESAKAALRCLAELVSAEGVPLPGGHGGALFHAPEVRGVPEARWRQACEKHGIFKASKPRDRAKAFTRARDDLRTAQMIEESGGLVWARGPVPANT